ncbi:hypothetical protein [Epilithonimonas caeni]|uniref:hypothetical protein n=1 Tax=Epilithonimonas caeni TaxID=365343 RepID=UPI0004244F35|nr:hypothetical protein [Epilithonimonas caeni]
MRKTYVLWFAILAFLVIGCRNDNFNANETHNNQQALKFRVVPKSEIPQIMNALQTKTNDFKVPLGSHSSAMGKTETVFGEINTNYIIETTNGTDEVYYTFSVSPYAESASETYNLEVKTDNTDASDAKIVVYEPTAEWLLNGNNDYLTFSGNRKTYSLDGTLESTVSYVIGNPECPTPPQPCPDCPTTPSGPGGGTGGNGGGIPGGGAGGGGGTGTAGGTNDDGGNGGGSNGGSACPYCVTVDPDTGNCTQWIMVSCPGSLTAKQVKNCPPDNGEGGGGGVVIYDETKTPCAKIKISTNDSKYKTNITTLQGKTGNDYESGFRLGNPVAGSGQAGTQNQILQNKPGTREVDMKVFNNTFSLMHSHYDGLFPIFSPGDLLLFNQWVVWANSWNAVATNTPKIQLNDLTLTLVTSNGNYLLSFAGTTVAALPAYTQEQFDVINKDYSRRLNDTHTNGNFDMDKLEKEFLKFVKDKMNMTGLKLFKVGSSGTNTEIYLEGGNRKTKDCPN